LILQNFEKAILVSNLEEKDALMTFAIVGGGPTGVELAGALCELKKHVLPNDYPELDFRRMRVILVESGGEVLQSMSVENQQKAYNYLKELGTEIFLNTRVIKYDGHNAETLNGKPIKTANLIWAAGIKGAIINGVAEKAITPSKRILVNTINQIEEQPSIFAIGDIACMVTENTPRGHPQVAPVAIQQGELLAKNIEAIHFKKETPPFVYNDQGNMATVGRNRAVVESKNMKFGGFLGWAAWMFVHLMAIVGYRNRIVVLLNWIWSYLNYDRNIRLIIRPFSTNK
jgi:NADH dehydrogenase